MKAVREGMRMEDEKMKQQQTKGNRKYQERKEKEKKKQAAIAVAGILTAIAVIVTAAVCVQAVKSAKGKEKTTQKQAEESSSSETTVSNEEKETQDREKLIAQADRLCAMYDYDKAIATIQSYEKYSEFTEMTEAIKKYEKEKSKAVKYDNMTEITHIFFHTLIADTKKAFDGDEDQDGYNEVMTTIDEFNKIMESMYKKGYVMVSIHDISKKTVDKDGNVKMEKGEIYLPPDKKPFVLSQDDVSYYEYMEGDGFATRIVIGENGKPTCEMLQDDGTTVTGDFDMVPLIESFVEKHPDFSYRGAKGILALTGYNGVLGYRTDTEYKKNKTYKSDVEQAKKVAQCLKDNGWEFASHTWGHMHSAQVSMKRFKEDTDKWEKRVETILGETDVMIFPFGEDIGDWRGYDKEEYVDMDKLKYLQKAGFYYFCNVDSNQYWIQFGDTYFRMGRRNLDGQRMYYDMIDDEVDKLSDLFDVNKVFDKRRPTPVPK